MGLAIVAASARMARTPGVLSGLGCFFFLGGGEGGLWVEGLRFFFCCVCVLFCFFFFFFWGGGDLGFGEFEVWALMLRGLGYIAGV